MDFSKLPINLQIWLDYWMPWIRKELNLQNDDRGVIQYWLDYGINNLQPIEVTNLISERKAICFGAGPNLEEHMQLFKTIEVTDKMNIISVDGATRSLFDEDISPNIVVSDLDGLTMDLLQKEGDKIEKILILAHGDNKDLVKAFYNENEDRDNIVWCTQGAPLGNWVNTLGFTDGDRAIALCVQNNVRVLPLGYNLSANISGRASKPSYIHSQPLSKEKKIKLEIAYQIIKWLNKSNLIYTLDSKYHLGHPVTLTDFILYK
ncbi:MAG: 6-hydroxymethylpterin diphosphokinase MptE-like protein [Candidatus Kariarchaeaceae archaeon]|jgi:uncharacterized Rossmann fold enzyme